MVPVYLPHGINAAYEVSETEAQELVTMGMAAVTTKRGKSIRLKHQPGAVSIRGLSCQMAGWVSEAAAEGKVFAMIAAASWIGPVPVGCGR